MHEYTRISAYLLPPTFEGEEFADALFSELAPWGKDQTFTGLTHGTPKGAHTPHGWGVLEHHEGFLQACAVWRDGLADGPGMWSSTMGGKEQCGYGTWVEGKRHGFFALIKEGGTYVEEYDAGELKRRIKWRKDKLHVTCARCGMLFIPSANTADEKFCRFHLSKPDYDGRYPCCGALHSVNPRGCATSMHVEPSKGRLCCWLVRVSMQAVFPWSTLCHYEPMGQEDSIMRKITTT
ncbi:unnamed protein product [Symbiodinium pilosum]|uniref:Uncharacterized protein n=1 Tax=Symbiodinium pilosum TaxID=2952 RepID=A0A812Q6F1_SYMPI|nr:unnamed protein product [Symbiodinium pilosum]